MKLDPHLLVIDEDILDDGRGECPAEMVYLYAWIYL
jgi:hypothetical protein